MRQLNAAALRDEKARARESEAFVAGKKLANGGHDVEWLVQIAQWKSPRRRELLGQNSDDKRRQALTVARSAVGPETKIEALESLQGVGVRMASAILTAMDPLNYLVIDVRALDALGMRGAMATAKLYAHYLTFCRETSRAFGMPLRDFDRALWKAGTP
jgi:hypothetical protein